jgi:hypothetical protein
MNDILIAIIIGMLIVSSTSQAFLLWLIARELHK